MAPSIPLLAALFSVSKAGEDDELAMLQASIMKTIHTDTDDSECRCPGYFEADCRDAQHFAQGCRWEDSWCQCLGPVTTPPVDPPPLVDPAQAPAAVCPAGWEQKGDIGADIGGCGLQSCGERYDITSEAACATRCDGNDDCVGFSYAPMNGDRNHAGVTACTIYNSDAPTGIWTGTEGIPTQVLCGRLEGSWVLLAHQTMADGGFSASVRNTFMENSDDPSASLYMNVGADHSHYLVDGKYHLRLVYTDVIDAHRPCNDGPDLSGTYEAEWFQSSWITEPTVTDFETISPADLSTSTGDAWMPI